MCGTRLAKTPGVYFVSKNSRSPYCALPIIISYSHLLVLSYFNKAYRLFLNLLCFCTHPVIGQLKDSDWLLLVKCLTEKTWRCWTAWNFRPSGLPQAIISKLFQSLVHKYDGNTHDRVLFFTEFSSNSTAPFFHPLCRRHRRLFASRGLDSLLYALHYALRKINYSWS